MVASNDPRVQAALLDYFARLDQGERVDPEAFLARHADVSGELRSLIAFDEEARRLAEGASPKPNSRPAHPKVEVSTHSVVGQAVETSAVGNRKQTPANPPASAGTSDPNEIGLSVPSAPAFASLVRHRVADPPPVPVPLLKSTTDLPELFGRYLVKQKLGAGAMGAVYLAEDSLLQRKVALKTPTFEDDTDGELLKRFYREARAVSKLKHNNLCGVYDVGEIDGRHYISMEFVPGKKLQEFIKPDKPMTEKQAMAVVRKIALAMHEAHTHGVIHRDLKPDNIMVNEKGEPVVMDFGLVHKTDQQNSTRITQRGTLIGSPAYMSKEQVEGDPDKLTGATDQYSLGVILYQLLTSKLPFEGGIHAVLGAILVKEPPPPSQHRPDLNPHLEAVCLKMMVKEAGDRYPSMKAAADALAEVAKGTSKAAGSVVTPVATPRPGVEELMSQLTATFAGVQAPSPEFLQKLFDTEPPTKSRAAPVIPPHSKLVHYGSLAAGLAVLLAITLWFRSGDALVKIEVLSDGIEVKFQNESITFGDGEQSVKVTPGPHRLHITSGNIEFDSDKFTLKKGENPVVTVELVKSEVVTKLGDMEVGRKSLSTSVSGVKLNSTRGTTHTPETSQEPRSGGELPVESSIDLLAMVKFPEHAVLGRWKKSDSGIIGEPFQQQRFMVPVVVAGSYQLICRFTRHTGFGDLSLILPVGDTSCIMSCVDSVCGLNLVDGRFVRELAGTPAAIRRSGPIANGVSYELQVTVNQRGQDVEIQSSLDGEQLISWKGRVAQLSCEGAHSLPNSHSIGLHSFQSALSVHRFELRLDRGGRGFRLGDDWKNPLFVVADEPTSDVVQKCLDWNGKKYFISDKPLSLPDAQLLASQFKGRLLTISSADEEKFIFEQSRGLRLWMAGWRPPMATLQWRDERNRPLRYFGNWGRNQPDHAEQIQWQLSVWTDDLVARGWHDVQTWWGGLHACIEWGEEYLEDSRTGAKPAG
ncbi:MAG: protein kinase, partial [Planctomycetaceae bacterium]|nr:protein kinase [Planctomycetaceae bacterium]